MKAPLSYVPALPPAAGIVSGIIFYHIGATTIALVVASVCFLWLYARRLHYWALSSLFVAIGILVAYNGRSEPLPESLLEGKHPVVARVVSVSSHGMSVDCRVNLLRVGDAKVPAVPCRLVVFTSVASLVPGQTIEMTTTITPIPTESDVPYQRDSGPYLRSQGICYQMSLHPSGITVLEPPGRGQAFINKVHDTVFNAIVCSPVNGQTSAFLVGVILGDRSYMDHGMRESFKSLGIAHVLALSGLHVGILASLIMILLWPIRLVKHGLLIRSVLVVILIWLYAMICGMGASIMRASVMITVFTVVRYLQRGYFVFNSLLLSVIIILLYDPYQLFTPGFQLSVCAVASILVFTKVVPRSLKSRPVVYFIANSLVVPVAAMLGTGMISAYYFHSFPRMFLLSNVFVGIVFPWLFVAGVLLVVSSLCSLPTGWLAVAADMLYRLLDAGVNWLSGLGVDSADGLFFSPWAIVPYMMALVSLGCYLTLRRTYLLTLALAMVVVTVSVVRGSRERVPVAELYIPRVSSCTNVVICDQSRAFLLSTAPTNDAEAVERECNDVYADFLASRMCDRPLSLVKCHNSTSHFEIRMPWIYTPGPAIYIADSDTLTVAGVTHATYVVVCRNYSGAVTDLVDHLRADTLLLSSDIRPARRKRLLREAAKAGVPTIDLRRQPLRLMWY